MAATPSILVVDDFAAMREIVFRQLQALGLPHVHLVASGEEALRLLEIKPVKLILSDWSMPGMSGLELLLRVRRNEKLKKIPFILVTAEMQRQRIEEAVKAGVHDFLLKPFKPDEFARKIMAALSGPRPSAWLAAGKKNEDKDYSRQVALPTVLVVDDTPANLTLAAGLLREDYQVKLAPRGDKALQLCAASPPDLILLDIMMPEMDGFEVCRRLKQDPVTAHIPVIFLTAVDDVARTVEGFALGAVDYVAKPIEPAILKARVATALRLSQAHENLRQQYDIMIENARLREEVEQIARHDLKNPLAAIIGLSSGLLDDPTLAQGHRRDVETIEQAAHGLLELIHLSGDLLKMEQGRYRLQPQSVDLAALIGRVAEENRLAFSSKGVAVLAEVPPAAARQASEFPGDGPLLYSMLHNLTRNAAEAASAGDAVRLELAIGDSRQISIRNPGSVPVEIRGRFFEKYATHGKANGSGLGTYSAKLIAEAHGGTVAMETSESDGTVVTVTFPL